MCRTKDQNFYLPNTEVEASRADQLSLALAKFCEGLEMDAFEFVRVLCYALGRAAAATAQEAPIFPHEPEATVNRLLSNYRQVSKHFAWEQIGRDRIVRDRRMSDEKERCV